MNGVTFETKTVTEKETNFLVYFYFFYSFGRLSNQLSLAAALPFYYNQLNLKNDETFCSLKYCPVVKGHKKQSFLRVKN